MTGVSLTLFALGLGLIGAWFVVNNLRASPDSASQISRRDRITLALMRRRHRKPLRSIGNAEDLDLLMMALASEHAPNVVVAAQRLGNQKAVHAVSELMWTLDSWVNHQPAGWREVAVAIVEALVNIGDVRALPLLRHLENVRGIGFIPQIRNALATMEPQANLLRPGSPKDALPAELLRPLPMRHPEEEPSLLLRAGDASTIEEILP